MHQPSNVTVYVTEDYKLFKRIRGNRALNTLKIKKMVRDLKHGLNFLPDFPILVSGTTSITGLLPSKLNVIDGQHRLEVAIQMRKPVYYIIRQEEMDLHKIARVNSLQEKWKPGDFINCYIEQGIQDYKKLYDFMDTYKTPVSVSLKLLANGVVNSDGGAKEELKTVFQQGQFKCKHWKQAVEIVEACKQFETFPGWNSNGFIVAITKVMSSDLVDWDELVEKFNKYPEMMEVHGSYKGYLLNLEQIYNKGNHKRRVIYE